MAWIKNVAVLASHCRVIHHDLGLACRWSVRHASSQFNGVYWHASSRRFVASVFFDKKTHYAGAFMLEADAAKAYDGCLRTLCSDGARLRRSLNFPSASEASFTEAAEDARARGLAVHANVARKEQASLERLQAAFLSSPQALTYEIVQVSRSSKIDAIFRPRNSCAGGLALQLKSASPQGRGYAFIKVGRGRYTGMLLVLVPLDRQILWALPGAAATPTSLYVTPGSARDDLWQVSDLGQLLENCWKNVKDFPHVTLEEALLLCSGSHQVEEHGHLLMAKLFSEIGLCLSKSFACSEAVDSILSGNGLEWHVQEKVARTRGPVVKYMAALWKHGGALGRLPYSEDDFDILLVVLLDDSQPSGLFICPSAVLASCGCTGQRPVMLHLYPPWALPKTQAARSKHAWQLEHFVDLRVWNGESPAPLDICCRLVRLLQKHLGMKMGAVLHFCSRSCGAGLPCSSANGS